MRNNILIIIIVLLIASCNKDEESPEPVRIDRTIIVYMAADNDLWDVALINIEEIKQGYKETGVNLIVLMDLANKTPCLLRITEEGEQTIKTYSEFNSADPSVFEPWALVLHEAVAAGLPVLSSEVCGAVPYFVIHNFNGFTFLSKNVIAIEKALLSIVNSDEIKLLEMSHNSRKLSERITPKIVAKTFLSVL
ncbi:MAG: glycosyltransferase [Prevotellaceae bacterium]|jgi:hypothetical protein|nr:glycosyltransferase [Prevotellaceae bacterium]